MNLHIIALGKGALHLKELKAFDRAGNANVEHILIKEAAQLTAATPKGALRVVLDERGKDVSTVQLAQYFAKWRESVQDVVFYIGSADGLDVSFKQEADLAIRLSSLTLPHMMVRVLLAEQLYRAWSLLNNHPYHRI
jgi:23S rRNA (pseudouridine1915-N3)-methyltransferase